MSTAPNDRVPLLIPVRAVDGFPARGRAVVDVRAVISEQRRGRDATVDWRTMTQACLSRGYPKSPPAVAATFVAQWFLQGWACATLFSVERHQPLVPAAGPWIVLDPQAGYPREVLVAADTTIQSGGTDPRAAYREVATDFIDGYRPGLPMSSRQRSGLVHDVWKAATRASVADVVRRQSCCLIYALPGLRCCAGCPRSASGTSSTSAVGEQGLAQAPSVEQS